MSEQTLRQIELPNGYSIIATNKLLKGVLEPGGEITNSNLTDIGVYSQEQLKTNKHAIIKAKYMITNLCNQKCYYCYNLDTYLKPAVSFETAKKIMKNLYDSGVRIMQFHGGEPTLFPRYMDLLEYVDSLGMLIFFFTNASSPFWRKQENFDRIKKLKTMPEIRVSLLAGESILHDALAGNRGCFDRSLNTVKKLVAMDCAVSMSISLTTESYEQLAAAARVAKESNCKLNIITELYSYMGEDKDMSQFEVRKKHIKRAREMTLKNRQVTLGSKDCYNGLASITLDANGDIVGCERNVKKTYGNILDEDLTTLVEKEEFQKLLKNYYARPKECASCKPELKNFCVWCPAVPDNMNVSPEKWRVFHCAGARKRRAYWYGE